MPWLPVVFGMPDDAELVEQRVHLVRDRTRVVEVGAGLRVEVDAQLVGVLGIVGARRPHVEAEAAEVHRPRDVREVGDHQRVDVVPFGVLTIVVVEPVGRVVGHALLEERRCPRRRAGSAP